jgi:hypothetical protein
VCAAASFGRIGFHRERMEGMERELEGHVERECVWIDGAAGSAPT